MVATKRCIAVRKGPRPQIPHADGLQTGEDGFTIRRSFSQITIMPTWGSQSKYGEFEIVTTGPNKWYDTRARKGGGGAIDLTMHVLHVTFVDAVKLLIEGGQHHG